MTSLDFFMVGLLGLAFVGEVYFHHRTKKQLEESFKNHDDLRETADKALIGWDSALNRNLKLIAMLKKENRS